jgi:methionyl-tRNA synthetase
MTDEIIKEEVKKDEVKTDAVKVATDPRISYDDFKKVEIKVGKILSAEKIEKSEKLLKLSVDFSESMPRQIVSGIAKYFADPAVLVGKKVAFVTNLEPKPLMGLESNGMILAVGGGEEPFSLFEMPDSIPTGAKAK